jgi:ubiquitin carboxyl-terminal hydrolase 22/27/51
VDLEDALRMVFSEEVIEGFRCDGCGKVPGASKRLSIEQLPRCLVIQVKRFQQDVKLRGHISCPLDLNMLPFSSAEMEARGTLDSEQGSLTGADEEVLQQLQAAKAGLYNLKVVVEHRGRGLNSGHFVAYVLMGSRWFLCNDKSVNEVRSQLASLRLLHGGMEGSLYDVYLQRRLERMARQ